MQGIQVTSRKDKERDRKRKENTMKQKSKTWDKKKRKCKIILKRDISVVQVYQQAIL